MSHPASPAFQSNALPAILPLSKIPVRAAGDGRFIASTLKPASACPCCVRGDGGAVLFVDLARKVAPMIRQARADLTAVARS